MFVVVARMNCGKSNGRSAGDVTFCDTRAIANEQARTWGRMQRYDFVGVFPLDKAEPLRAPSADKPYRDNEGA